MKNGDIVRLKHGSGSWAAGTPVTVVSVGKTGRVSVTMPNLDTYAYDADDLEPVELYDLPGAKAQHRQVSAVSQMLDVLDANQDAPVRAVIGEVKAIASDLGYTLED